MNGGRIVEMLEFRRGRSWFESLRFVCRALAASRDDPRPQAGVLLVEDMDVTANDGHHLHLWSGGRPDNLLPGQYRVDKATRSLVRLVRLEGYDVVDYPDWRRVVPPAEPGEQDLGLELNLLSVDPDKGLAFQPTTFSSRLADLARAMPAGYAPNAWHVLCMGGHDWTGYMQHKGRDADRDLEWACRCATRAGSAAATYRPTLRSAMNADGISGERASSRPGDYQ